jgi:hypothetical protein
MTCQLFFVCRYVIIKTFYKFNKNWRNAAVDLMHFYDTFNEMFKWIISAAYILYNLVKCWLQTRHLIILLEIVTKHEASTSGALSMCAHFPCCNIRNNMHGSGFKIEKKIWGWLYDLLIIHYYPCIACILTELFTV